MVHASVLFLVFVPVVALPPPAGWHPNFEHAGAWTGGNLESSPLWMGGKLYLMMSKMGPFAPDGGEHAYFCVYDGVSGEEISCPASSSGHAFCSAIIDRYTNGTETAWVFCSAWDRANSTSCPHPGWGCGDCAYPGKCYVGAWSSKDLVNWSGPSKAILLPAPYTVPNVGVSMIPLSARGSLPSDLPRHQAFMVLETQISVAINTGSDGDLGSNWQLLPKDKYGNGGTACPTARYNPIDKFYYVFGGGDNIDLSRSASLLKDSWQTPPRGPMQVGCIYNTADDCSPSSPAAHIAPGYWTNYWANKSDQGDRVFLKNMSKWDWSVNDADFSDQGGAAPTRFIYAQCQQSAPKNFTGKGGSFYQLGLYNGTEFEFLASYYNTELIV